jgi:hypothetical protein
VDGTEARLIENRVGGKALFDLVEEAREVVRGVRFDEESTEVLPNFLGCRRVELEGLLVDAYQIEVQIGTQLPVQQEEGETDEG